MYFWFEKRSLALFVISQKKNQLKIIIHIVWTVMGLSYLNCVGEERERERERESILIPWLTEQDNISFINEESFFKLISFIKIASMTCG